MAKPWRAFLLIFLVHVGVQGYFLAKVPARYLLPHTRWEISAVAMALYERGEFADPYCLPTGPTAHMPPFQPALIAAVYHLLGPTLTAGYVLWVISIAFYGIMYAMLPWLGERLGLGARAGLVGGLVGALIPRWPSYVEGLAAVAIGLMAAVFVRRWNSGRVTSGGSFLLGLAMGLSFLVTPSLLPVPTFSSRLSLTPRRPGTDDALARADSTGQRGPAKGSDRPGECQARRDHIPG